MSRVRQAGAIVVRPAKSGPVVLLVTARRNPEHWIFPKGHIEPGESAKEAALREAEEEAGVVARLLSKAGRSAFDLGPNSFSIEYWLAETDDLGKPEAGRKLEWLTYKEALERLTFDNMRAILRKAWRRLPAASA